MQFRGGSGSLGSDGALAAAAEWASALLTGSTALIVATLAMAVLGFMMFSGRLPLGRAAQVILGCFILFSARAIALAFVALGAAAPGTPPASASAGPPPAYRPAVPAPEQKDPYAGAAVPPPRQADW